MSRHLCIAVDTWRIRRLPQHLLLVLWECCLPGPSRHGLNIRPQIEVSTVLIGMAISLLRP